MNGILERSFPRSSTIDLDVMGAIPFSDGA